MLSRIAAVLAVGLMLQVPSMAASKHHAKTPDTKSAKGVDTDPSKPGMAKAGGGKVAGPSHADGSQDLQTAPK